MKSLLLLTLLLPGLAPADQSIQLNGNVVSTAPMGCRGTLSSTPTYALNSVSPTVASTVIDLGANPDVFVSVTGAANIPGGPIVGALFSPTSTGTFLLGYKINGAGNACVPRLNRYMKLANMSQPSSTTYAARALSVTASYILASGDAGSSTVDGMTLLTTTAAGYAILTKTAYALVNNTITSVNVTGVAGVSLPSMAVRISTDGNIRWEDTQGSTAPYYMTGTAGTYQPGSTTAIVPLELRGASAPYFHFVGSSQNCNLWLTIYGK
jgi:hypothetical protein